MSTIEKQQQERIKELERQLLRKNQEILEKDQIIEDLRSQLHKFKMIHKGRKVGVSDNKTTKDIVQNIPIDSFKTHQKSQSKLTEFVYEICLAPIGLKGYWMFVLYDSTVRLTLSILIMPQSVEHIQTRDCITKAIEKNDFLKNIYQSYIQEIVDYMFPVEYKKDSVIIQEGSEGSMLYVIEDGQAEATNKDGVHLSNIPAGKVFGELAILYNCKRTASVRAVTHCKLWAIERNAFQFVMIKGEITRQREYLNILKRVPRFKNESDDILNKIADHLEEVRYEANDYIIKQGSTSDKLYIIFNGKAKETKRPPGASADVTLRTLARGDYFGETALDREETRVVNIQAQVTTDCLTLDREALKQALEKGPTNDIADSAEVNGWEQQCSCGHKNSQESNKGGLESTNGYHSSGFCEICHYNSLPESLKGVRLSDFNTVGTLGAGGFSQVTLVQTKKDPSQTFALKQMRKHHIVETRQQEHIFNEKIIMKECRSDFIVKLHRTFRDEKYLYMMLEACLGGELWTVLRDRNVFDDNTSRFYAGCVVEALQYLHTRGIVYRDLKPENLLLDKRGYLKLVDFGFAKKIGHGRKTYTFCGTPEYVAPELILNRGHDTSADLWSLGILIFELLTGSPPFASPETMKTYNKILKGIGSVDFPKLIGSPAKQLIKSLCRDNPTERLGYGVNGMKKLRENSWFTGLNWEELRKRTLTAPYEPTIKDSTDTGNFDSFGVDENGIPPDDLSGWDKDF